VSLFTQSETASEETTITAAVLAALQTSNPSSTLTETPASELYALHDLPFPLSATGVPQIPDVCTPFRTKLEATIAIPRPVATVGANAFTGVTRATAELTEVPTLQELGYRELPGKIDGDAFFVAAAACSQPRPSLTTNHNA